MGKTYGFPDINNLCTGSTLHNSNNTFIATYVANDGDVMSNDCDWHKKPPTDDGWYVATLEQLQDGMVVLIEDV